MMPIQIRSTEHSPTAFQPQKDPVVDRRESNPNSAVPSWEYQGKGQLTFRPEVPNRLQQGLKAPAFRGEPEPGSNSQMSVEQLIKLVDRAGSLKIKRSMLEAYLSHRAFETSAEEMVQLGRHISMSESGLWNPTEKAYHDEVLAFYLKRRDYQLSPQQAVLLANASFVTGLFDDVIKDYVEKQVQNPSLSSEHMVQLARKLSSQSKKATVLHHYVDARSVELSVSTAVTLAKSTKFDEANPRWEYGDKEYHDQVLRLWAQARLKNESLSFGDLLQAAGKAFGTWRSDQMLLDYVRYKEPSLDERIHLAALATRAETAEVILKESKKG